MKGRRERSGECPLPTVVMGEEKDADTASEKRRWRRSKHEAREKTEEAEGKAGAAREKKKDGS